MKRIVLGMSALAAAIFLAVGCSQSGNSPAGNASPTLKQNQDGGENHEHLVGAHGGKIFTIGAHQYHGEAVLETGGVLRLFTFDKDESRVLEVPAEPTTAFAKPEGERDAVSVVFLPEPQKGDADGMTSQFVARLPKELQGKKLSVVVQNFRVGKDRFRVPFEVGVSEAHIAMPAKVTDADEKKLYLTPGGLYTTADIQANGGVTPSQKFKGIKPMHDAHPRPGEKLCPISETKANDKFTWVIGGKNYEFCCPPCVDEFLTQAKQNPESIKPPEEYRKK